MKAANFILSLAAIAISSVVGLPANDGRIGNGMAIPIEKAAYMVLVTHTDNNGIYCGGSLVAPDYVVTAAHCVRGKSRDGFSIIANVTTIYEIGVRRKVSLVSIHPGYNNKTKHSDVALLLLNEPIPHAVTLELCQQPLKEGDEIQVSGWGRLGENKPRSPTLQTVFLTVASNQRCANEFDHYVEKNMFCASAPKNQSTCKGDSGGPAVLNGQLCGVLSFGHKRDIAGKLEAYTDIYAVRQFIQNLISLLSHIEYRNYRIRQQQ